ncbi:MAG: TIGR03088 family PEP-CTERM/XrtA system glycosyltransferase [Burkholderiaceae bacterium]|nr:TIGR03088 family PEP-CTERM/XrtA system glycosyltransferase [Burkholderiaceae bacterium]
MTTDPRPLVLHVMHRFDTGGLENGIVNLINHMPEQRFRHAVMALTQVTDFRRRIQRPDVEFIALDKPPGHGFWLYPRVYRLLRRLRPAIVHSRNLAALEMQVAAWAARVPVRIHGEHGRDVGDLDGSNVTYQRLRRAYTPFVHHYVALSRDLAGYLKTKVHVPEPRITQIYNGVDLSRFTPAEPSQPRVAPGCPFSGSSLWLVGTVGRMQTVKDQLGLARAFVLALEQRPDLRSRLRLVMIGDGPLREQAQALLQAHGAADLAWLPGERSDVAQIMSGLDCFVLPSLGEGISNTILEAMACGLPVIATDVGGNAELVNRGHTGLIVPAADAQALADAILNLVDDPAKAQAMGQAGRRLAQQKFSLPAMVGAYQGLYDRLLDQRLGKPLGLASANQRKN